MPASRQPGQTRFIGARPSAGATALLIAFVSSFVVLLFLHEGPVAWVTAHFGLNPMEAIGRRPWQLVTSWLLQPGLGTVISDVFGVWIFATAVEQQAGRARMFGLFVGGQLAGSLAVAIFGRALHMSTIVAGSSSGVVALVLGFGSIYGQMPLRLFGLAELKAKTLAWLVIGLGLFVAIVNLSWLTLVGDLAALGAAAILLQQMDHIENLYDTWRLKRLRGRRFNVIEGGRGKEKSRRYMN